MSDIKLGYKASNEQFAPRELLEYGVLAEQSRRLRSLILRVRPPQEISETVDLSPASADVAQPAMAEHIS